MSGPKTDLLQMMTTMEALLQKLDDTSNILDETGLKMHFKNEQKYSIFWSQINSIDNNITRLKMCQLYLKSFRLDGPPPPRGDYRHRPDFEHDPQELVTRYEELLTSIPKASDLKAESTTEETTEEIGSDLQRLFGLFEESDLKAESTTEDIEGDLQQLLANIAANIASLKTFAEQVSTIMLEYREQLLKHLATKEQEIEKKIDLLNTNYAAAVSKISNNDQETVDLLEFVPQYIKLCIELQNSLYDLHLQQKKLCHPDNKVSLEKKYDNQQHLIRDFINTLRHQPKLLDLLEQEETNIKSRIEDLRQTYISSPVTTNVDKMQTRLNQDLQPIATALNQLLRQQDALYPFEQINNNINESQIHQLRKEQQKLVDFFKEFCEELSIITVEKIIDERARTTQLPDLQNFPKKKGML